MKHFFILALFLSCAGAFAAAGESAHIMDKNEIKAYSEGLSKALATAFADDSQDIIYSKLALANAKGSLRGCYHADESFIGLKKLWSEDCFKVIGEVWRNGHAPYSLMKQAIAEDQELKEDKKLLPLLDSIYGEEAVALAERQSQFIKESFVPQIKACDNNPGNAAAEPFSCQTLMETAKTEGFNYFQLAGAIESAVSELETEYKVSAGETEPAPAAEPPPEKRQTSKP